MGTANGEGGPHRSRISEVSASLADGASGPAHDPERNEAELVGGSTSNFRETP